jgi:amino acid transporter
MSIAGFHDAPGKTANVGFYGVHENVQHGDFVTEHEERDLTWVGAEAYPDDCSCR